MKFVYRIKKHKPNISGPCSAVVLLSFGSRLSCSVLGFMIFSLFYAVGRSFILCSLRTLCSFGRCSVYVRCWGFQFLGGLIFLATLTTNNHRASQFFVRFIRYSFCGAIFFNVTGPLARMSPYPGEMDGAYSSNVMVRFFCFLITEVFNMQLLHWSRKIVPKVVY